MSARNSQVGGDHYKRLPFEPVVVIRAMVDEGHWKWEDANAAKYLFRWRLKNGIEDLRKARHYIDLLIEHEESRMCSTRSGTTDSDTGE